VFLVETDIRFVALNQALLVSLEVYEESDTFFSSVLAGEE
jgi:hypothetical protein